jgi:hypothetical protein
MAEVQRMTVDEVVGYLLEGEGLDFLSGSLSWVVQQLMEAEVSELVGEPTRPVTQVRSSSTRTRFPLGAGVRPLPCLLRVCLLPRRRGLPRGRRRLPRPTIGASPTASRSMSVRRSARQTPRYYAPPLSCAQSRATTRIAATRWVAWADFVAAGLAVREGSATEAIRLFSLSEARFAAEALVDGQVSVAYARLAAHRLAGADDDFVAELELLARLMRRRQLGARYYGRGNRFTREAIEIERAEFFRTHTGDQAAARRLYEGAASSRYPVHAALWGSR